MYMYMCRVICLYIYIYIYEWGRVCRPNSPNPTSPWGWGCLETRCLPSTLLVRFYPSADTLPKPQNDAAAGRRVLFLALHWQLCLDLSSHHYFKLFGNRFVIDIRTPHNQKQSNMYHTCMIAFDFIVLSISHNSFVEPWDSLNFGIIKIKMSVVSVFAYAGCSDLCCFRLD